MGDQRKVEKVDPFLANYDAEGVRIAAEFLTNWLPFLSRGLCKTCTETLSDGIRSLQKGKNSAGSMPNVADWSLNEDQGNCSAHSSGSLKDSADNYDDTDGYSLGSWKGEADALSEPTSEASSLKAPASSTVKKSWADMALEDELLAEEDENDFSSNAMNENDPSSEGTSINEVKPKVASLSRDQREHFRFSRVQRKKDFICLERVHGKIVNIVDGLELHTGVFSAAEQKRIVSFVEELQEMGKAGELKPRTYSAPQKWMRGKGRITLQFGCCYNYATDRNGNPPGILKTEMVDPLPQLFKVMIKRLVRWQVLPPSCVPDSCIVNIYEEGDCIPPHIDNHDFVRPFCTVSFLSECEILFGSSLKIVGPGEFDGSFAIPLAVGSVLVINGNGADVAKHCVPAVPFKRISITFRRMDESKRPSGFVPEPDLQGLQPIPDEDDKSSNKFNNTSRPRGSFQKPASGSADRTDRGRRTTPEYPDARYSERTPAARQHQDARYSERTPAARQHQDGRYYSERTPVSGRQDRIDRSRRQSAEYPDARYSERTPVSGTGREDRIDRSRRQSAEYPDARYSERTPASGTGREDRIDRSRRQSAEYPNARYSGRTRQGPPPNRRRYGVVSENEWM